MIPPRGGSFEKPARKLCREIVPKSLVQRSYEEPPKNVLWRLRSCAGPAKIFLQNSCGGYPAKRAYQEFLCRDLVKGPPTNLLRRSRSCVGLQKLQILQRMLPADLEPSVCGGLCQKSGAQVLPRDPVTRDPIHRSCKDPSTEVLSRKHEQMLVQIIFVFSKRGVLKELSESFCLKKQVQVGLLRPSVWSLQQKMVCAASERRLSCDRAANVTCMDYCFMMFCNHIFDRCLGSLARGLHLYLRTFPPFKHSPFQFCCWSCALLLCYLVEICHLETV